MAKDKRAIARAKALPIDDVEMTAEGTEIDGDRATLRVDMVYTFDGHRHEYVKTSRMTRGETPEGWRVSGPPVGRRARAVGVHELQGAHQRALPRARAEEPEGRQPDDGPREGPRADEARAARRQAARAPARRSSPATATDTKALTKDLRTISALVAVAEAQVALAARPGGSRRQRPARVRALALLRQPQRRASAGW